MAKKHYPYRIRKSIDGQYYFVFVSRNNKVISTSETYKRKQSAVKGIYAHVIIIANSYGFPSDWIKDETI